MKIKKNSKGFTLIELLVVVTIIGILSAVGLPQYMGIKIRSKRAEAHVGLSQTYAGEMSFFAESHYFTPSMDQLGMSMSGKPTPSNGNCIEGSLVACGNFYAFWIENVTPISFLARANGWPDQSMGPDTFVVFYP